MLTYELPRHKPTRRQMERRIAEFEELEQRDERRRRHKSLLAEGYVLVKADQRGHPAHSAALIERIDALAHYIGHGNFEPSSSHKGKLKRAHRLWKQAWENYEAMLREPDWWRVNAKNQRPLVFPPNTEPLPATVPEPVYVKDGATLPYMPLEAWG